MKIGLAGLMVFGLIPVATAAPIRVLIVDGFSNHNWRQNTALIRAILEPTKRFDVTVSTAPPTAAAPGWDTWRPRFSDYDVVIQTCNDIHGGPSWPRAVQIAFEHYVRDGGGVYIYHSANNAFASWPAYNEIIGLGWRRADQGVALTIEADGSIRRIPAGTGSGTNHGSRRTVLVRSLTDDPMHRGFPRAWLTPDLEVYTYARGPADNLTVLSYARDAGTGVNWPIEWTVTYGQGRVYSSTFGHIWANEVDPASMRDAGFQTLMVRVLQWLAKRPVDFPVPVDFPTADHVSLRPPELETR